MTNEETGMNFAAWGRGIAGACVLAHLALGVAPAAAQSPSFTERMRNMFLGQPPAQPPQGGPPVEEPECPGVDVRSGASTLTVHGPGDQVATNVRYQATIGQTARECALVGATMTMKVGVQGRVILGPLGGPGKMDVPVRLALVEEGPNPKTVWSKLYRIPVAISAGQVNVPFVHVEQDLTFPMPKDGDLEPYVVYVGFDQLGAKQAPSRTRQQRPPR